jgi:hypothetical protein
MTKLKLFVWTGFAMDYTDGLAFAIAKTEKQARKVVIEYMGYDPSDWGDLKIRDLESECGYGVAGGG